MDSLKDYDLTQDPLDSFQLWWELAKETESNPTQMTLSTFGLDQYPAARTVLFKGFYNGLFSFFTNYQSPKAKEIEQNARVSLVFWWERLGRQVRIKGEAKKMHVGDSMAYFLSRPRESQLASAISEQSSAIQDRQSLIQKFKQYQAELGDQPIPYPKSWGGYLVQAHSWEFFLYGEHRLNDRFLYQTTPQGLWEITRLQP